MLKLTEVRVKDENGVEHVWEHPGHLKVVRTNKGTGHPVAWIEIIVNVPSEWDKATGATVTPTVKLPHGS